MDTALEARLHALEVFPNGIETAARIFTEAHTPEDLDQQVSRREHMSLSGEQYLFTYFSRIVKLRPEILQEGVELLKHLNIPQPIILEYLQDEQQPSLLMSLLYGKIFAIDIRQRFRKAANQFALDKVKEYLGT